MKKYRVLKSYPKKIMNSNRLVTLIPGETVYLKYESQLKRLIQLGFIKEVLAIPKKEKKPSQPTKKETKQPTKPHKSKAKNSEVALADKTGE